MCTGRRACYHGLESKISEDKTRIIVAMEDQYRAYREVIAAGIEALHPGAEVTTIGLDALEEELARLEPRVVVCSQPKPAYADGGYTWVELAVDPTQPMKVHHAGRQPEKSYDPTLEALLAVINEAEEITKADDSSTWKRPSPCSE
jgi:hypothetical protein